MLTSLLKSVSLFSEALALDLSSKCFLELYDGRYFIGRDGSLASLVRVEGLKEMRSFADLESFLKKAVAGLNSPFGQRGRAIQIWYERNPDLSKDAARELTRIPRLMAERLGLEMGPMFDDRERLLSRRLVPDALYIVLWTRRGVLTQHELSNVKKNKPPSWWPGAKLAQDPFEAVSTLRIKHSAWVDDIISSFAKKMDLTVEEVGGHEAIGAMRRNFRPNYDQSHFKPWLPGDPVTGKQANVIREPGEEASTSAQDVSHLLWPRLPPIIVNDTDAEVISGRIIRLGEVFYAPIEMSLGPQDQQPFDKLFDRLSTDVIPWRMSVLLEGDGHRAFPVKNILASLSGWSSPETKLLKQALDAAQEMNLAGTSVMRTRICFATWASNFKLAEDRQAKLQQAVESWGSCITSAGGDPLALTFSTMLALDPSSAATSGLSNIRGALRFLPWAFNASPLKTGPVTFLTETNRAWNWDPGTRLQNSAVELIVGPPGSGKSVLMNTMAMAFILSPTANPGGHRRLPRYSLLDIGPSSYGLIETLRAVLPPDRRDEAQYHRLTMEERHSINPLDLQPGLRAPLDIERSFLVNLLCLLVTPVGQETVPIGLAELAGQVIDAAYKSYDDNPIYQGQPKLWAVGEDPDLDDFMDQVGITRHHTVTTWYTLADKLHQLGYTDQAILAQRYAVPRLADLMTIVKSDVITDVWKSAKLDNGSSLIDIFWRGIFNTLTEYPIFSSATKFSLGKGRVVALDLQLVTGSGGNSADRKTAIMYMLGRFALMRDYYCSKDSVAKAPDLWKNWHSNRARENAESPARFAMDEFHRTNKAPGVRELITIDIREGRKFNIQITLASQIITDFDMDMIELATSLRICGNNTAAGTRKLAEIFNLSPEAFEVVERFLNGPGPRGAPFLAINVLKNGRHEHKLYNVLGPVEAWAYSTSPDDVNLRTRAAERVGFYEACAILGRHFPTGSADRLFTEAKNTRPNENPFDVVLSKVFSQMN